jgi:CheY-like chemotaxis protein
MKTQILIIDDDPTVLHILEMIFLFEGFHVVGAKNGKEALAAIEKEIPHVILSDVIMPDMDGYEFLRRIRTQPDLSAIPVIIFSTNNSRENIRLARSLGANDFIAKPFRANEILSAVQMQVLRCSETPKTNAELHSSNG